jgi:hypothetical protein
MISEQGKGANAPLIGEVGNANGEFSRRHDMKIGNVIRGSGDLELGTRSNGR